MTACDGHPRALGNGNPKRFFPPGALPLAIGRVLESRAKGRVAGIFKHHQQGIEVQQTNGPAVTIVAGAWLQKGATCLSTGKWRNPAVC